MNCESSISGHFCIERQIKMTLPQYNVLYLHICTCCIMRNTFQGKLSMCQLVISIKIWAFWVQHIWGQHDSVQGAEKNTIMTIEMVTFSLIIIILPSSWPDRDQGGLQCRRISLSVPKAFLPTLLPSSWRPILLPSSWHSQSSIHHQKKHIFVHVSFIEQIRKFSYCRGDLLLPHQYTCTCVGKKITWARQYFAADSVSTEFSITSCLVGTAQNTCDLKVTSFIYAWGW